jgi:CRP-like cAMP-binding protein
MQDLDFATGPKKEIYDPAVALAFFKYAGTVESIAQNKSFFVENEKSGGIFSKGAKMYLLLEGEVSVAVKNKVIGTVGRGQIFGEMASIGQMPRSATAIAKTNCRVISLDEKQFQKAIQKAPDFAVMLMSIMISRVRHVITLLTGNTLLSDAVTLSKRSVFDKKVLADLEREFEGHPPLHAPKNKVIMTEGEAGAFMYVVLEGRVRVSLKNRTVEKLGPGGVLGEMALVDHAPRLATATAEIDTSLLAINRKDFQLFIKTKPDFTLSLLKAVAERLRFMNSRLK